jgi:hypothetical protein
MLLHWPLHPLALILDASDPRRGCQTENCCKPRSILYVGEVHNPHQSVSAGESRTAWVRLLAKMDAGDPMICTGCGAALHVLAVITVTWQVYRILRHLLKTGTAPLVLIPPPSIEHPPPFPQLRDLRPSTHRPWRELCRLFLGNRLFLGYRAHLKVRSTALFQSP